MPYQLEYKRTVDSTWTVWSSTLTGAQFPATITGLVAGTQYDTRCLARDVSGNVSTYSATSQASTSGTIVWSTVPTITFTQGAAANIGIAQYDSSGATDTITHTAGTLPTGVTYDQANKRYSYNGVGAVGGTNGHILTADDGIGSGDWATRSTASGVIKAAPLNSAAELTAYRFVGPEIVAPLVDSTLKPTGQPASIRFTSSNADTTQSGTLMIPFGQTFGPGTTFWLSFRQYMAPEWAYMLHPATLSGAAAQGMKQIILSGVNNSHEGFEVVLENSIQQGAIDGYNANSGGFQDWSVGVGSDIIFQSAIDNSSAVISPDSVYSSVNGGTDPDTGSAFNANQISYARYGASYNSRSDAAFAYGLGHPLAGEMRYPVNQWATYTIRVVVGSFGVSNTRVTLWCAPDGQAYVKLVDKSNVQLADDVDHGFNAAWPLAYYTARLASGFSVASRSNSSLSSCTAIRTIGNGSVAGAGTLTYTAATKRFTWAESGGSAGTARGAASWKRFVNCHSSGSSTGNYATSKHLGIEITNFGALPATDQTDIVTIQTGRGTQTTNIAELIVSTQPINATGGFVPT